jgi:hypothetical protein
MRAVILLLAVLAGPLVLPARALADQPVVSGLGKASASARIDFRIVIPYTIALRVDATAVAADASAPSRVLGGRSMTKSSGVQGVQLQSNMRAVVLSQDPRSPAFLTAASP